MQSNFSLLAFALLLSSTVRAHTWLENIMLIGSNGSFVGTPGYPRGYGPRLPNVDPDTPNVYKIIANGQQSDYSIPMCKSSQTIGTYTPGYGPLTAAPQDSIALRYLENGHVTKIIPGQNRPAHNGTVFIYGTKTPSNTDTYLGIHRVWNAEGTGGDKRGKLIATRSFDDGQCFQVNPLAPLSVARKAAINWPTGEDLPCQTDVQIPEEAGTSGNYTMYWVWEWPQLDPVTSKIKVNETYTSCLDIQMTSKSAVSGKVAVSSKQQMTGANMGLIAVQGQLDSQFLVNPTALPQFTYGPAFSSSAPAATSAAPQVQSSVAPAVTSSATASVQTTAPAGFVTVTVTSKIHETEYVTVTKDANAPAATSIAVQHGTATTLTHTSTMIVQPLQASASASHQASGVYTAPTGIPSPQPFLRERRYRAVQW